MRLKKILFRAAVIAGLAVLAFVLLRPPARVGNRVVLDERRSLPAAFAEETTLRNVTKNDLTYTIEGDASGRRPLTRTLKVGAVDRIPTAAALQITFNNGARQISWTLDPGKPYSFRYDERGLIRAYPGSHGREDVADLAPYVPTPAPVVEKMLALAGVAAGDVVYDIGCGDGRMIIAAAKTYRARGVGIDIDPARIEESRANAKREGVEGLTRFLCMDATKADISEATVLALYLLPESLESLKPLFERDLRPGTRIVSHNYRIPGWDDRVAVSEVVPAGEERPHKIILYVMPGAR